jgi:outer membrane protein assembly factor BamB
MAHAARFRRRSLGALSPALIGVLVAACGGGGGAVSPASALTAGSTITNHWHTYHLNAARTGNDTKEPSFASLAPAWTEGPLDGAVYAEPLVEGGKVIVATENDSVYAFDEATGQSRWHVQLGTPRTSNFPCGNIMPLGITSTPVIDSGYLYVVEEVEKPAGTYSWHLAKLNASSGAVVYNKNITPSGLNTDTQQQRSALAMSNGNIVVSWGGLFGDCGSYHGWVETVAESTGARVAQWHDTPKDNEGAIWGASGPAVDGSGNIYITTGNGSTTDVSSYDYSDSVIKLSPSLSVLSFFAPGPPQAWTSLNSSDTDLGSVGPALLHNGLLFAIGKGGRGYLLNQVQLPNNSNPGGGENFSQQVCHVTQHAAFSGTAYAGGKVYVPCSDGIAAVKIDSSTAFHTAWYSTSGSSAPIVAGGLVWSLKLFGGNTLYGLNPTTGAVASTLTLPAATEHFATPTSSDGRLFVAAGNALTAFSPTAAS